MATATFTHRRTSLRIYDGTPTTPQYITIPFVQPGEQFPLNRPRATQEVRLNRDTLDSSTHFIRTSDAALVNPVLCTFTAWLDEQLARAVLAALSNPFHAAPWLVSTATFLTASGTGASILNGAGGSFKPPTFTDDPWHQRVHVETRLDGVVSGTNAMVIRHEECYFPPDLQQLQLGETTLLSSTYWIYGKMTQLTAFSTGVDRTPAVV
jgi:hypothetical protein